jgi:peptide-methionine (S)-S-oxide reductase
VRRCTWQVAGIGLALLVVGAVALSAGGLSDAGRSSRQAAERESRMSTDEGAQGAGAMEVATLGGGCFWCLEAVYERIEGVKQVVSGYAGGTKANPTYEQVCTGTTGHAEVVQITYDPREISYGQILELFWKIHDPTTPNRQGADVGTQYRSIILYHDQGQKEVAERSMAEAAALFDRPIVTQIEPLRVFYRAEDYHQDYYDKHPYAGYCQVVIRPKLQKLSLD